MPTEMVNVYDKRTGKKLVAPVPEYFLDMFPEQIARTPQGAAAAARALALREGQGSADQGTPTRAAADSPASSEKEN